MAERKPVALVDGALKELPSSDFLPAANIPEVTAAHIHAATSKATPVDADELGLSDSAASWGLKKLTFANLAAWVRSIALTGLSTATNAVITASDTVLSALGKLQKQVSDNLTALTSHTGNTSNPHGVTKAQVGLGNVDNTADSAKPISTATQAALNAKQSTLVSGTNIKTVNGNSLLGSGNLSVTAGISDAPSDGKTYGRKDATWAEIVGGGATALPRSVRTSNTMLGVADKGKLIDITSGTFSQTFDAVATLGDEWCCWIRNSGTGDITLDPNSTETIDGVASFVLYPGAVRVVLCDGTALYSIAVAGGAKTFTTSGSYVWAPGIQQWGADLIAGGAGGGGGARDATRYNGGGGGAGERWKTSIALAEVTVGASTTCAVGAKGTGGAAAASDGSNGAAGTAGGVSSIGSLRSVSGGSGVGTSASIAATGRGGVGGGTSLGTNPTAPMAGHLVEAMVQGSSIPQATEWGGPAGRRGNDTGANGVQARLGGQRGGRGGAAVTAGTAGTNGANPGDGGDGGAGNTSGSAAGSGGDGADGKITIVEVL